MEKASRFTPNFNSAHLRGAVLHTPLFKHLSFSPSKESERDVILGGSGYNNLKFALGKNVAHNAAAHLAEKALVLWSKKEDASWVIDQLIVPGGSEDHTETDRALATEYEKMMKKINSIGSDFKLNAWTIYEVVVLLPLSGIEGEKKFKESMGMIFALEEAHELSQTVKPDDVQKDKKSRNKTADKSLEGSSKKSSRKLSL